MNVVVEGEKCVDALASIGIPAVTSLSGAGAASKTDWTPLAGKDVLIIADNDAAGMRYADEVKCILARLGCVVSVKQLPGPEGYDVADLIEEAGEVHPLSLKRYILGGVQ